MIDARTGGRADLQTAAAAVANADTDGARLRCDRKTAAGAVRRIGVDGIHLAADLRAGIQRAVSTDGRVDPSRHLDVVHTIHCVSDAAGKAVQPCGNAAGAALRVVRRLIHKFVQLLKLLLDLTSGALAQLHTDIRLELAGDTADILSSADAALIRAAQDLAAAASGNAADVVADVLVADGREIRAVHDRAGGIPGNTAGIRRNVRRIGLRQAREIHGKVQIDAGDIHARIGAFNVHEGAIPAGADIAEIVARNAAGHVLAENRPACTGGADDRGGRVLTGYAADTSRAGDRAGEAAIGNKAPVLTGNAADAVRIDIRSHAALHVQIAEDTALLHHGKQSRRREAPADAEAADRVAAADKRAAEARNGLKVHALQRNIAVKNDTLVLRPCIERAGLRKIKKLLRTCDMDGLLRERLSRFLLFGGVLNSRLLRSGRILRLVGPDTRRGGKHAEHQAGQNARQQTLMLTVHPVPPPLRRQSRKPHSNLRLHPPSRAAYRAPYR